MSARVTPGPVSDPAPALATRFPMARVIQESLKDFGRQRCRLRRPGAERAEAAGLTERG